jgi:hypothetical protein
MQVRNAATRTFVSLTIRTLGFKNDVAHEGTRRAVSSHDFLRRFSGLHTFLLAELGSAAEDLQHSPNRLPRPSLLPILVLLSRLQPSIVPLSGTSSGAGSEAALDAFLPSLEQLITVPQLPLRRSAARALCAFAVPGNVSTMLTQLISDLPPSDAICGAGNRAHGHLLTCSLLLRVLIASCSAGRRSEVVRKAAMELALRMGMLGLGASAPAVATAFVQCIEALLFADAAAARPVLMECALPQQLLRALHVASSSHSHLPMWSLWLKHATRLLLSPSLEVDLGANIVLSLLGHSVAEVQAEALRCWSRAAAVSGGLGDSTAATLWRNLPRLLSSKQHPKVVRRSLQLRLQLWTRLAHAPLCDLLTDSASSFRELLGTTAEVVAAAQRQAWELLALHTGQRQLDPDSMQFALMSTGAALGVVFHLEQGTRVLEAHDGYVPCII